MPINCILRGHLVDELESWFRTIFDLRVLFVKENIIVSYELWSELWHEFSNQTIFKFPLKIWWWNSYLIWFAYETFSATVLVVLLLIFPQPCSKVYSTCTLFSHVKDLFAHLCNICPRPTLVTFYTLCG